MATSLQDPPAPSMTALVGGIIGDAQDLIRQQLALFKEEIKEDMRKTKEASLILAIGAGITLLGGLILDVMLPLGIHWRWPDAPLWACFGIVGVVQTAVGVGLVLWGIRRLRSFNPVPEQSVEALKENLRWTTHPTNPS
jgi:hypothetical protein